ncbi:MAG: hypothetical protein ABI944_01720 [Chthoniobacterales bacterium]
MALRLTLLLSMALTLLCGETATARSSSQSVWSGLVVANNVDKPDAIPAEISRLEGTLKQLFGYNQFTVIGQSRKALQTGDEDWLASSKFFSLHVHAENKTDASYLLNLQLFQENKLLLETEAKLSQSSPLVIKGPQVGNGQLLLLLVLQ